MSFFFPFSHPVLFLSTDYMTISMSLVIALSSTKTVSSLDSKSPVFNSSLFSFSYPLSPSIQVVVASVSFFLLSTLLFLHVVCPFPKHSYCYTIVIHVYNKNEASVFHNENNDWVKNIRHRKNIILLGDSLGINIPYPSAFCHPFPSNGSC